MPYRLQDGLVPLALAHLMRRTTDTNDEVQITFRVQADRRRVQALANGAVDRRVRRPAAARDADADAVHSSAAPALSLTSSND